MKSRFAATSRAYDIPRAPVRAAAYLRSPLLRLDQQGSRSWSSRVQALDVSWRSRATGSRLLAHEWIRINRCVTRDSPQSQQDRTSEPAQIPHSLITHYFRRVSRGEYSKLRGCEDGQRWQSSTGRPCIDHARVSARFGISPGCDGWEASYGSDGNSKRTPTTGKTCVSRGSLNSSLLRVMSSALVLPSGLRLSRITNESSARRSRLKYFAPS